MRNHVMLDGTASFTSPHEVLVAQHGSERRLSAETILIASGSEPARPDGIAFDWRTVLDSDDIVEIASARSPAERRYARPALCSCA